MKRHIIEYHDVSKMMMALDEITLASGDGADGRRKALVYRATMTLDGLTANHYSVKIDGEVRHNAPTIFQAVDFYNCF